MSPAFGGSSEFFAYSRTSSLNPNVNLSSNPVHQPQSSCFSFGGDECNQALNFDISKMGPDPSEQLRGRRLRYPLKKLRRKVESRPTKFVDSLSSDSLDPSNENVIGTSSVPTPNASNNNKNACGGNVDGEKGGHEMGKFCTVEGITGTEGNSIASNSNWQSKGFVSKTSRSSSSFVFGAGKSCAELNHNKGYGAKDNGLQSNSNLKNENAVFGAENSSSGFVFSAGSDMKSSLRSVDGVFGANACDSAMKSSLGDGNFLFTASLNDNCSSTKFGRQKSSGTAGLSRAQKMQNFNNFSFVFGATKGELDSNVKLKLKGSVNRSGMQSEVDRSGKFGHVASVSNGKKTSVAGENSYKKLQKEECGGSVWKTVPNVTGKVKLDAEDISEKHGHSSFVFSTGINDDEKNDNSFVFGAKGNGSTSTVNVEKGNHSEYISSKDFVPKSKGNAETATETNGVFVFGAGGNEKLSSNGNIESRNAKNHLHDEKMTSSSDFMTLLNDAMRSNFKFVVGSSSSPGGAFYKIPLSKLFDEMKNLNIEDSKGVTSADQVKDSRSNSHVCSDQLDPTQNNWQMSSEGKSGTTLQDQHKDANVGDDLKCSDPEKADTKSFNHGTHEYEYDSKPDISVCGSVKVRQSVTAKNINSMSNVEVTQEGVSSPFAYAGVLGKENQPSNSNETSVHVEQNFSCFGAAPTKVEEKENLGFTSTPVGPRTSFKEFNTANLNESSSVTNLFTKLNKKFEFCAHSRLAKEKKLKKNSRKLRQRFPRQPLAGESHLYKEGSSPKTFESPGGCSPMDFSPYQHCTGGIPSQATEKKEGDSTSGRQRFQINENDKKSGEPNNVNSKDVNRSNLKSATSSSAQDGLSSIGRQYRKKYKLKIGNGLTGKTVAGSAEFSSLGCNSSNGNKDKVQSGVAPNYHKTDREYAEQDTPETTTKGVCEHWRIRGNQAYKSGDLSRAEEFYTKGINSVKDNNVSGICSEPLLLCYSNRAATRMSLGRMREALVDCKSAAALEPSFHKVKMRAANCHLVLGEFQEAMQYYNDCLESGNKVCLDRRFTVEAADGLHKAQKVAECMSQSAELIHLRTSDAANSALNVLVDALSISCYSEQLLEMKGEALLLLQRYDEAIELCERTLHSAEKNIRSNHLSNVADFECKNSPRLWRWRLMLKSHFHLGRLEVALDLIEKQEELKLYSSGGANPETPIALAVTIRGLLERKKAGNEAFQSGKHTEAIEHYTVAISGSVESRPFAAICFCNRAAAHQALGQIVDAIADCSFAMALDGNYPKALSRRATLHEMIRDYNQAIDDLQRLITVLENQLKEQSCKKNGSSSSSKKELKLAQRRLSLMEDMANKGTSLDLYLILGIKESDMESDIKKAYRRAALRHHPDKVGQFLARNDGRDDGRLWKDIVEKVHEDADRLFKMIGEAYAVLSDADKRSKYNYERDIRDFCNNSSRNTSSRRPSDFNSSAHDGGHWSNRHSNFYSSSSGRNQNRHSWHESHRNDDQHSWW